MSDRFESGPPGQREATRMWGTSPWLLAVAAITLAGLLLRLPWWDDALFSDEISTYFIANADSLGAAVDLVRSDQEVTPPLYFVLAWAIEGLGLPPQWLRLAPLVAGIATIPLTFVLGELTVGRRAAAAGAVLVALSPTLILQSTEARAHGLMLTLVLLSTIALVKAVDAPRDQGRAGGAPWWIAYAGFSCAAIWTHYMAVFVLGAQLGWALWRRPNARLALVASNSAVVVGYLPWLTSGLTEDRGSPGNLIETLHPFGFGSARADLGQWLIGQPSVPLDSLPGDVAIAIIATGLAAGALGLALVMRRTGVGGAGPPSDGTLLVVALALATPAGVVLYSIAVDSLLTPRNLIASWPGLALGMGALVTRSRGWLGIAPTALLLGGFAVGAGKALDTAHARPDFEAAASYIEGFGDPDALVLEQPHSANPLSPLEVALNDPGQSIRQRPPVLRADTASRGEQERARAQGADPTFPLPTPSSEELGKRAKRLARGETVFVVVPSFSIPAALAGTEKPRDTLLEAVPSRFHHVESRTFPGSVPITVDVFQRRRAR